MPIPRSPNSCAKPGLNPWLVAIVVSIATFMEVLDTSIANVALPHIGGNLGAGQNESTWVLTSYLVANAIIIPISGWLSSIVGRKRFYMWCVALFTVSSFLCGVAPSLGFLLVCRVLQGIGGGGLAPSEQAMLADTFPGKYFGQAFAIYGLSVVVAPAIGPFLGGWITDTISWRWIFLLNVPFGILSLILTALVVQDPPSVVEATKKERAGGVRVDYTGFAFAAVAFGALQVVLDRGQEEDWLGSSFIATMSAISVASMIGMIVWETLVVDNPIVDLPLMSHGSFSVSLGLQFMLGFVFNATTVMIPQFVQQILGYNATNAGLILLPGGLALMFMMPIGGTLVAKVQPKYMMCVGLFITAAAMYHFTGYHSSVTFWNVAWIRIIQCIGLPLIFIPVNTIAYSHLPPGKSNNASALMNLMRNLGGSVGISLAATLLTRHAQVHQNYIAAKVSRAYQPFVDFINASGGFTRKNVMAFYNVVQLQATVLSYIDVFEIFIVGTLIVAALVLLLRPVKLGDGPSSMH